jgi:DNA repair protein RadC
MHANVYESNDLKTLIANTLREKVDSYTVEEIIKQFPTYKDLMQATEIELRQIAGIGPAKARQLLSAIQLSKLLTSPPKEERICIRSPQDAYNALKHDLTYLTQEHFVVIGLNTKNHILFKHTVTIGPLNASLVHPREVFRPLIRHSAASCIVAHNHPSGDPVPSREDIEVTKRLKEAGNIIGIELLDHIIIGLHEYYSLKEKGHI